MPTFVSPTGHPEVWDNKPIGYDTPEEWVQKIPVAVPAPTTEQLYASLRVTRDARLAATDKYMLADYPISEDNLVLVKEYRGYAVAHNVRRVKDNENLHRSYL